MKKIKGDLTEFPAGITHALHNCNVHNVMGAGIAKAFRAKYPIIFEADKVFGIKKGLERLGHYSFAYIEDGKCVVNLYGQTLGGDRPFNIGAYGDALQWFLEDIMMGRNDSFFSSNPPILGFPWMIGAGLAKGDWSSIKDLTEWHVNKYDFLEAYWVDIVGYEG